MKIFKKIIGGVLIILAIGSLISASLMFTGYIPHALAVIVASAMYIYAFKKIVSKDRALKSFFTSLFFGLMVQIIIALKYLPFFKKLPTGIENVPWYVNAMTVSYGVGIAGASLSFIAWIYFRFINRK